MHDLDPGDGKEAIEDEGNLPIVHADNAGEREVEIHVGHTYHLAKHPGFPNTSLTTLTTQFHAPDFLSAITIFLSAIHKPEHVLLTEDTRFDLYKRVTFSLPSIQQIDDAQITDVVHAMPFVPCQGRTPATPAHFDMVLVHYIPDAQDTGVKGK